MSGNLLFIGNLGPMEWVVILAAILVLFGGRKIPQLAKDLGSGIREFKKSLSGTSEEIADQLNDVSPESENKQKPRKKA